jgi:hypothetical protein
MLKDLSVSAEEKKNSTVFSVLDKPSYPPGLRINIDPEVFKKLEIEVPEIGSILNFLASAEVVSVNKENAQDDSSSYSISLQIQRIDIKPEEEEAEDKEQISSVLYGNY